MLIVKNTDLMTYQEFCQMDFPDNDNSLYELIQGELVKKSAPTPQHQLISQNINRKLDYFVFTNQLGRVLYAPVDVILDDYNAPQPDLLFISNQRANILTKDGVMGAPDLVVEIISPSSVLRDRVDKMRLYRHYEVWEYWLIDPQNQSFEVYILENADYQPYSFATQTGKIESKILVGFEMDLIEVFAGI
jgi:Uma2 family endonuclease